MPPSLQAPVSMPLCLCPCLDLVIGALVVPRIIRLQYLFYSLSWDFLLPKSDRLSETLPFVSPVTSGVSSPRKHIVPTLQVYSLKSSSCFFIRMKYRVLCSVQGFINDVLSGAGCSAYLHIKQLSEETFLLLLQGINQFKASSHHLYSFQLSLLLLK